MHNYGNRPGPYIYPRIPLEYPKIPLECPRIPQNTNNIKILKDFGFLICFYSVDGDISQKAMMIELLFVLLNYWSLVLFSFLFFIIIYFNSTVFTLMYFYFYFGDFVNIDFIHVNVVNSTC